MFRIFFTTFLILQCLSPLINADDISIDQLIRGVNKNRFRILSGEIYSKTTQLNPASKTEQEIVEWMKTEKKKSLYEYKPRVTAPQVEQFEKEYLIPYLNFRTNGFRENTKTELITTIFRSLNPNDEKLQKQNQYKITIVATPGHPLDSMDELFIPSDNIFLLTYDTATQVKQDIGNIVHSRRSPNNVSFYDSDYHYGYWKFDKFGKSPYHVPQDAKNIGKEKIDGVECRIITYISDKSYKVRMWVDPEKDFSIHRYELIHPTKGDVRWRSDYKDFKKYGNIWFPETLIGISYFPNGTLRNQYTVEVIDAEFNVSFPEAFFDVNRDYYKPKHTMFNQ